MADRDNLFCLEESTEAALERALRSRPLPHLADYLASAVFWSDGCRGIAGSRSGGPAGSWVMPPGSGGQGPPCAVSAAVRASTTAASRTCCSLSRSQYAQRRSLSRTSGSSLTLV